MSTAAPATPMDRLKEVVARHWGFHSLRPLQEQAMCAVMAGRDSLLVLPTGGGKSLCYQAPAVLRGDTTVVVSPLIALMKDQVDALRANGVPATQIDSSQSPDERFSYEMDVRQGAVRLLFVSPERLVLTDFYRLLQTIGVKTFAIDEAHCISHWGHDFRPEYRQLNRLKELFPAASVHAYTATATERVRKDIVTQLGLRDAEVLVGDFDRPNLNYRILPRRDTVRQVLEIIDRHRGEAGIVYCLRRRDVDNLTSDLRANGVSAEPYHAGLTAEQRRTTQEAFAAEKCDIVVATIAFGMGIDRSNVRFVLHTAMPKSMEHYQQETGRAGRDGLEAECVLLHSGGDFMSWKWIMEKSAAEPGVDPSFLPSALKHLEDLDRYCRGASCRHSALVQYFGQTYSKENCAACDICLGDTELVPEAATIAKKILSCVARVQERFGVGHVVSILRGENTEAVRKREHDQLTTFGLLREFAKGDVRDWIHQLVGQAVLAQEQVTLPDGKQVPIMKLNDASWEVMRGQRTVRLMQPMRREKDPSVKKSRIETDAWEGVDKDLFEQLRILRRKLAQERRWQPYLIFGDTTLRELARSRPSTLEKMRLLYGVGEKKLRDFGEAFLEVIHNYCGANDVKLDPMTRVPTPAPIRTAARPSPVRELACKLFREQCAVEDVMHQTGRSHSTVMGYLAEWIRDERPVSIQTWVTPETYQRVSEAVKKVGAERLKPIFIELGEQVPYDAIRLVVWHCTLKPG